MTGRDSERRRLRALIARAGVAMLMTTDDRGGHAGRPMLPLLLDGDPHIYFLTHQHSRVVAQIVARPEIGLTIDSDSRCYVCIAGRAFASRDAELIGRLWHPTYRAWFPAGQGDEDATVLRVVVDRVEYWEPPRSRLTRVLQAAQAIVTRRAVETPMKTLDGL
jgi:general stress protein 26